MDKSVSQERKTLTRSKKGMGICPEKSHKKGHHVHAGSSKTRLRTPSDTTKILKISKAAQARIRIAAHGIAVYAGKSIKRISDYKGKIRIMTAQQERTQILHLVFSVLRKADISSRHVLGAQLYQGHWWIQFESGWIKTSQLLRHKVKFKHQYPTQNHN